MIGTEGDTKFQRSMERGLQTKSNKNSTRIEVGLDYNYTKYKDELWPMIF